MQKQMNINTHEYKQLAHKHNSEKCQCLHRLTGHYTDITVAIGQNIVERGLLRQTANDRRLGKRAHFLFLLYVEAVHLVR